MAIESILHTVSVWLDSCLISSSVTDIAQSSPKSIGSDISSRSVGILCFCTHEVQSFSVWHHSPVFPLVLIHKHISYRLLNVWITFSLFCLIYMHWFILLWPCVLFIGSWLYDLYSWYIFFYLYSLVVYRLFHVSSRNTREIYSFSVSLIVIHHWV